MPAKRTTRQREADLVEISRLWAHGITLREIADAISKARPYTLSHVAIKDDVDLILSRWREFMKADIDELRAGELSKINRMECEAYSAWERSKEILERRVTEKRTGKSESTRAQISSEPQYGDPRFMTVLQWCIDKRCKLLGLDAPIKIAPTDPTGDSPYESADRAALIELAAKVATMCQPIHDAAIC